MGTRFASTQESPLHHNIKENIVRHGESDTVYGSNFDGLYARVMKTPTGNECASTSTGWMTNCRVVCLFD